MPEPAAPAPVVSAFAARTGRRARWRARVFAAQPALGGAGARGRTGASSRASAAPSPEAAAPAPGRVPVTRDPRALSRGRAPGRVQHPAVAAPTSAPPHAGAALSCSALRSAARPGSAAAALGRLVARERERLELPVRARRVARLALGDDGGLAAAAPLLARQVPVAALEHALVHEPHGACAAARASPGRRRRRRRRPR